VLFVGDDWAEDHHDVEVQDEAGRRLSKARLEEGIGQLGRNGHGARQGVDGGPGRTWWAARDSNPEPAD
jgi:hypothetical protein